MPPSLPVLTRQQVREVDRLAIEELGMPGVVLMENAGRGAADAIHRNWGTSRAWIVCGPGNNGGDGFVIARHLDAYGWQVDVFLIAPPQQLKGDALANYQWLGASGVKITLLDAHPEQILADDAGHDPLYVVDAMLGTGATGRLRPSVAQVCRHLNQLRATRIAIDLPTGLDADTGDLDNDTFMAHLTCTFVAAKPGLCLPAAKPHVGTLQVLPIGVPTSILRRVGWKGDGDAGK